VTELTREVELVVASSQNPVSRGGHQRSGVDKTHQWREMTTQRVSIQGKVLRRRKGEGGCGAAPCRQLDRGRGAGVWHATRRRRGGLRWPAAAHHRQGRRSVEQRGATGGG
jgi:hypothetical protein